MTDDADAPVYRKIEVIESSRIPALDFVFAFGPMAPFVIGAATASWLSGTLRIAALQATALWGTAILLFLSGVRRGLSFRTENGPTVVQLATMLGLFTLGFGALIILWLDHVTPALLMLVAGYAAVVVLDPIAARRGEAPLYFHRLRRWQIPIALIALTICLGVAAS